MSIKTYRPTTPARRQMTVSGFDGVDKQVSVGVFGHVFTFGKEDLKKAIKGVQ